MNTRIQKLKLIIALPMILATTILLYTACRRQFGFDDRNPGSLIENARSWFETDIVKKERQTLATPYSTLPKDAYARTFARMEKLSDLLNWNDAKEYNQDGFHYIVVPVRQAIKPLGNQNFEVLRGLVFYKNNVGIMTMNIIEVASKKGRSLENNIQDIASAAFSNKYFNKHKAINKMNASVIFYDEHYKTESSYQTINGTWSKASIKLLNKKGATVKKRIATTKPQGTTCQTCTTWYLVGYWYDTQTGEVLDYEILDVFEECTESGPPPPGYGETPDEPVNDDCSITGANALNELTSNSTVSNETQSISIISSTAETRTKKYQWIILKSIGWHLFSVEKGVHVKTNNTNPNLQWIWQSLEHQNIGMVGVVIGGHINYSLISAIPTIGQYNAIMDLDFKVKYSVVCDGSPFATELFYNSAKNFHVND